MNCSSSNRKIWSGILCIALILCCPYAALADGGAWGGAPADTAIGLSADAGPALGASAMPASSPPPVRTASTGEELLELLKEDAGGVIRAAGDLVADDWDWWDWEDDEYMQVTRPVTVDMGIHTLFVEGSTSINGPIHFTGSGTVIHTNARLGTDEHMSVSATGEGAVAIFIGDEGYWDPDYTLVEADGKHAIGVDIAYSDDYPLREAVVRARGAGSIGVRCAGQITLFLCQVTAEGEAVVSGTGDIVIDCSTVHPLPAAVEVSRTAELASHWPLTYYTPVGVPLDFDDETVIYHLYTPTERWPKTGEAPVDWNLDAVDYDTPGLYPISATVQPAFAALFPMVDWLPVAGTVKVLYLGEVYIPLIFSDPRGPYYAVGFDLNEPLEAEDRLTVYYRPAGEPLWQVIGEDHISSFYYPENFGDLWNEWFENREIDWGDDWDDDWDDWDDDRDDDWDDWEQYNWESDTTIYIHNFFFDEDIDSTFEIQLMVVRGGETHWSNIASVTIEEEGGGDREGDGWEDEEEPGGTEPPVTPPPTGGGSSGRSSTGSGGGVPDGTSAAAGNTTTTEQPSPGTEPPSDTAQPVISPTAATTPSAYPEGAAVYTATELAALALANPERIAFLEGNLRAVLPTLDLLVAVGGGSFAILLEESGVYGFHIRLYAENGALEDLGGAVFQVSLTLPDGYEHPLCTGEGGEAPARVEDGRIVCDLTRTGRYEITAGPSAAVIATGNAPGLEPNSAQPALEPAGQDPSAGPQAAWWIALTCVAACAAGFVFLRRRARLG